MIAAIYIECYSVRHMFDEDVRLISLFDAFFLGGSGTNTLFCLPSLKLAACTILQMKIEALEVSYYVACRFQDILLPHMVNGHIILPNSSLHHLRIPLPGNSLCFSQERQLQGFTFDRCCQEQQMKKEKRKTTNSMFRRRGCF